MTREEVAEHNEEALLCDGFDEAIIGVASRINLGPVAAYSVSKILDILIEGMDDLTEDDLDEGETMESRKYMDALEHFEYNIIGSWVGEYTPVFIYTSEY